MGGEIAEDGISFASVNRYVAAEGIVGAFSHVGGEDTAGAVEVSFKGTGFGGAGVALEETYGDMLGVKRLVHDA